MEPESEFFNIIKKAAEKIHDWIQDGEIIRVITHLDPDGLSAGGIMAQALYREGGKFHLTVISRLDIDTIKGLEAEKRKFYIFIDMGSGQIKDLEEHLVDREVLILDHHKPISEKTKKEIIQVNPHLFGIDGVTDLCGAGVAYFVAKAMDEQNVNLANLAIVGAIGDRQDKDKFFELSGLNKLIIKDAIDAKILKADRDLRFFGKESRPIHLSLKNTTEPFIPGISGNEENCLRILMTAGIKPKDGKEWRTISDLSQEEKANLNSAIIKFSVQKNPEQKVSLNLIGTSYVLLNIEKGHILRDAQEFASLLDACGRIKKYGLGISICMGDYTNLDEAVKNLDDYRKNIAENLNWLEEQNFPKEKKAIQYFHGKNRIAANMISTISSIISSSNLMHPEKALIGIGLTDKGISKISGRGNTELVKRGLDLGVALKEALKQLKIKGAGGGHNVAAGARIPTDMEEKFLDTLDEIIEKQLKNKK